MEIIKVVKHLIKRGTQYFWQYSVYIYINGMYVAF